MPVKTFLSLAILFTCLLAIPSVNAGIIAQCGTATCSQSFSIKVNGNDMGGGNLIYDAKTGAISLSTNNIIGNGIVTNTGGIMWTAPNGNTASVGTLSGNADPILGFAVSASTGASGGTFAFAFDLPIAISGTIATQSKVSYTLGSTTNAGAQIKGIGSNKVVQSWDIDSSVGGLADLNKKVDVGDTHFHTPGPDVTNSPVYSASNSIVGDLAYNLMAVNIGFTLSANSNVGISGFVSQTSVPLPGAAWLMLTGIGFLAARRKSIALL